MALRNSEMFQSRTKKSILLLTRTKINKYSKKIAITIKKRDFNHFSITFFRMLCSFAQLVCVCLRQRSNILVEFLLPFGITYHSLQYDSHFHRPENIAQLGSCDVKQQKIKRIRIELQKKSPIHGCLFFYAFAVDRRHRCVCYVGILVFEFSLTVAVIICIYEHSSFGV